MLLWLLERLAFCFSDAAVSAWEKITFRAALAAIAGFLTAVALGPYWIAWLRRRFREPIRSDSATLEALHQSKQATPTMGGLFLVAGLIVGVLLFADLSNRYVQLALLVGGGLGCVGAVDDLVKLRGRRNGISARAKLAGQLAVAGIAAALCGLLGVAGLKLNVREETAPPQTRVTAAETPTWR